MNQLIRTVALDQSNPAFRPRCDPTFAWRRGDLSLAGYGRAWSFDPGFGEERFLRAENAWRQWLSAADMDDQFGQGGGGPLGFGSFTFDAEAHGSVIAVPRVLVGRHGSRSWITTVGDVDLARYESCRDSMTTPDRPRYVGPTRPDWEWMEAVAQAVRMIESGPLRKVVLARDVEVWSKAPFDKRLLLDRLSKAHPECFTFLVNGLVGASPELLLRLQGRRVESVALAGTAPRHPDPARDRQLARELLASDKNLLEPNRWRKAYNRCAPD